MIYIFLNRVVISLTELNYLKRSAAKIINTNNIRNQTKSQAQIKLVSHILYLLFRCI